MKKCYHCKVEKNESEFSRATRRRDGLNSWCRQCVSKQHVIRRARKLQENPQLDREHYLKQQEYMLEYRKTYKESEHGKKVIEQYNSSEHGKVIHRKHVSKRRASILNNGKVEDISITELYERDCGMCLICMTPIEDRKEVSLDHIIPLSRKGTHTWDNVQLAHLSCNRQKHANTSEVNHRLYALEK